MLIASLREVIQQQAHEIESLQARLTAAEQKAPPLIVQPNVRLKFPFCFSGISIDLRSSGRPQIRI